jgi:hypothetical protein
MTHAFTMEIPKWILVTLNNLYEVEKKLALHGDVGNAIRNVEKMKDLFAEMGVFYEDPMGQEFKETRSDLDATICGSGTENLVVVEVIKPIVRAGEAAFSKVVQKGIVVVESKEGNKQ